MAMIPPPEGLSAEDYDAIEAAVTETVRGRWFLAEYTRRSRVDELRQMLDGLARLEQSVRDQQHPADPSIRLVVQRLREISQRLDSVAGDMRAHAVAETYCGEIETQARAVGGLLRGAPQMNVPQVKMDTPPPSVPKPAPLPPAPAPVTRRAPEPPLRRQVAPQPDVQPPSYRGEQSAALTRLDRLSTAEKVTIFS